MRITGLGNSFPPPAQIARAYGAPAPSAPQQVRPTAAPDAAGATSPVGRIAPATPTAASTLAPVNGAQSLVAGQVPGPITFDGVSVPRPTQQGVFHMYTRAADKIEAATAIQIGRTLDIKG